jgi:hypothetical protein
MGGAKWEALSVPMSAAGLARLFLLSVLSPQQGCVSEPQIVCHFSHYAKDTAVCPLYKLWCPAAHPSPPCLAKSVLQA